MNITIQGFNSSESEPVLRFYIKLVEERFSFLNKLNPEIFITSRGDLPSIGWKLKVDGVWFGDYRFFETARYVDSTFVRAVEVLVETLKLFGGANKLDCFRLGEGFRC